MARHSRRGNLADQVQFEMRKFKRALAYMQRHHCESCDEVRMKLERVQGLFSVEQKDNIAVLRAALHTFRCSL